MENPDLKRRAGSLFYEIHEFWGRFSEMELQEIMNIEALRCSVKLESVSDSQFFHIYSDHSGGIKNLRTFENDAPDNH